MADRSGRDRIERAAAWAEMQARLLARFELVRDRDGVVLAYFYELGEDSDRLLALLGPGHSTRKIRRARAA